MSYRIDPTRNHSDELRRIAREQIGKALASLREDDLREGVHDARTRFKKIRALLRLYRPHFGNAYDTENARFRDAGRLLAPVRDATTRLEALRTLEEEADRTFESVADLLTDRREEVEQDQPVEEIVAELEERLEEADRELENWSARLKPGRPPEGFIRSYRRLRKAFRKARKEPSPERFHECRKRAKDHRYHCRLLESVRESLFQDRERDVHKLTDLLGDHHDLVELERTLRDEAERASDAESLEAALTAAERSRTRLEKKAFRLGEKLLSKKPKTWRKRAAAYWRKSAR